jgi:tetratricopeptide (TPR) repeat protein
LLKHRLIHDGKTLSDDKMKQLSDLLLSEMSIVNARVKDNLESQKLHLLFQSFFFTNTGDYKSALKTFFELNRLFEKNMHVLHNPPWGYFSSLDGILDSLRAIGYYAEMDFYIKKLNQLDNSSCTEYYRFTIRSTVMIYQLTLYIGTNDFKGAIRYISEQGPNLLKASYSIVDDEKQNELLFYFALAYFRTGNFKKAQKYIAEILLVRKINFQSLIYKATRLLSVLIHYEEKDLEYLDYEIRSYKRSFKGGQKPLQTETLIFKTIKLNPDFNHFKKNEIAWINISPVVQIIKKDKYEMQLLKYFDFTDWIKSKFI